jgi:hypothetical protein
MRVALNIVGCLLIVPGGIWFLQGIGVLPGSFMTGQIRRAVHGGITLAQAWLCCWLPTWEGGADDR